MKTKIFKIEFILHNYEEGTTCTIYIPRLDKDGGPVLIDTIRGLKRLLFFNKFEYEDFGKQIGGFFIGEKGLRYPYNPARTQNVNIIMSQEDIIALQ